MKTAELSSLIWTFLQALLFLSFILVVTQRYQMYHPRSYPKKIDFLSEKNITILPYQVEGKPQKAFFYSPTNKPQYVWVMLGGNASLALEWFDLIKTVSLADTGYLMVDYPGYGYNEGHPSQTYNIEAVKKALASLQTDLGYKPKLFVLGHSLGSAVALASLEFIQPCAIVLVSPFTSMYAMVQKTIGLVWARLLKPFIWDTYNSYQYLATYHASNPKIPITIIHGNKDLVVPVSMGRELASISPNIHYIELPSIDHSLPYQAPDVFAKVLIDSVASASSLCN